jgi:predicted peptidase
MMQARTPDRSGRTRCGLAALVVLLVLGQGARAQFKVSEGGAAPPNAFGIYKLWFEQKAPGSPARRPYMMFCPVGYEDPGKKWPVLIFLHGAGERGADFGALDTHGPMRHAQDDEKFRKGLPMVVISPQCPPDKDWTSPEMTALVGELMQLAIQKYRCDPDRVYLTGLSLGGTGTWHVA